jgi:hypothetical protein
MSSTRLESAVTSRRTSSGVRSPSSDRWVRIQTIATSGATCSKVSTAPSYLIQMRLGTLRRSGRSGILIGLDVTSQSASCEQSHDLIVPTGGLARAEPLDQTEVFPHRQTGNGNCAVRTGGYDPIFPLFHHSLWRYPVTCNRPLFANRPRWPRNVFHSPYRVQPKRMEKLRNLCGASASALPPSFRSARSFTSAR